MFDKIADFILKHSKAIVIFWIVLLVCSVPFALKSGEVMKYDLNDMASDESESIQGLVTIGTYFPSTDADASAMPILVVEFHDSTGYANALAFSSYLNEKLPDYPEWKEKLKGFIPVPGEYSGTGTSIMMVGVSYADNDVTKIMEDTDNLRGFIAEVREDFKENVLSGAEPGFENYLTGSPALSYDMSVGSTQDIERIDPFTVLLILVLVGSSSGPSSPPPPLR